MSVRAKLSDWPNLFRRVSGLRCSFCRRSAQEVERLVSGASAYICDACIADCVAVLEKHGGFAGTSPPH
jgi:ClpX C4-type zinc finger